jgi:hypothetical protein
MLTGAGPAGLRNLRTMLYRGAWNSSLVTRPPVVAYLILSHQNPSQVIRLIGRIRGDRPESIVVVHHDPSKSVLPHESFADDPNVMFVTPTIAGGWGDFSVLEMVLRAIDTLLASGKPFDYATLISGQDYPIKPLVAFEEMLAGIGDGALDIEANTPHLDRYTFLWRRLPRFLENRYTQALFARLQALNRRQPWVRFVNGRIGCWYALKRSKPPLPGSMVFYKGSQWWTLAERCVRAVQTFTREHPEVLECYRRSIIPDESFFQTVLYNDARFTFVNDDFRYIHWDDHLAESPATMTSLDLPAIAASPAFFARKLDITVDADLIDEIDRSLLAPAPPVSRLERRLG